MEKVRNLLWDNAGAIFCYTVALVIFLSIILMDAKGIIILSM